MSPSPDPFLSDDSPSTASGVKQQYSLPLRTTQPGGIIGGQPPDTPPQDKKTTRVALESPSSPPLLFFGASKLPDTPPASSPWRGRDVNRPLPTFTFDPHKNQKPDATGEGGATAPTSEETNSKESPSPAPSSDALKQTPTPTYNPNPWALLPTTFFGSSVIAGQHFTFKDLHNTTPLPSRSPSPAPLALNRGSTASPSTALLTPSGSQNFVGVRANFSPSPKSLSLPWSPSPTPSSDSLPGDRFLSGRQSNSGQLTIRDSPERDVQPEPAVPYDLRDEETPQHRFFSPEFQLALRKGLGIAKETTEAIKDLSGLDNDATLNKFLETAKRLRVFHGSDTRTIAVLGDSGEGKSSLINSLLHFPGIAKTGDIGSACTSVVTEYRQKTSEQTAPITIEVEYLSSSEIEALLKELLWSYRQLYLPGVESDETSAQDYARYQRESEKAWSALEAAFKHKKEFKQERLRDMSDGALERITSQLLQWSQEIKWPEGGVDGIWKSTAQTADECCEKTELFMTDNYWPFTKIIRIYLNAQVLKTGVVLADLPGLQDTNLARVRATQDYLMRCNNIFIVAKISRAITDQSLKTSLFKVLARHVPLEWEESAAKSLNVAVVCTKSEDIDVETSKREFCGEGKRISPDALKQIDKEISDAKRAGDSGLKKKLKLRRELIFVNARNQHVTEGLQSAYASKAPDRRLEVFCVSNKLYGKHTRKGNTEIVQASGIPALRKFCHSITAEAQLREARHFLQSSLFSLLNSLSMWTQSALTSTGGGSAEEIKEVIDDQLEETRTRWTEAIRVLTRDINKCFEEQILHMHEHRHSAWGDAASSEGQKWHSWHWSESSAVGVDSSGLELIDSSIAQYNAWCRNNGNHSTANRGHMDWNAKIIWKMRTELEFQWDLVEEEIPTVFGNLLSEIKELLEDLKELIREECPSEFESSLADGIDVRIKHCEYAITMSQQHFARDFKLTRRFASESSHNSFVLQQMLPAYREASSQSGSGMAARQRGIVQGRISDETLFANIYIAISEGMKAAIKRAKKELQTVLQQTMEGINGDVDIALSALSETGRSADDRMKLEELQTAIFKLKDDAETVGRTAAE